MTGAGLVLNFHLHSAQVSITECGLNRLKETLSWRKKERHWESWKEPVFAVAVPVIYCCVTNPSTFSDLIQTTISWFRRSSERRNYFCTDGMIRVAGGISPCCLRPSAHHLSMWTLGTVASRLISPRVNVLETKVKAAPSIIRLGSRSASLLLNATNCQSWTLQR